MGGNRDRQCSTRDLGSPPNPFYIHGNTGPLPTTLRRISTPCRQAFGKTSTASTHDIDFFLPDTGPLSNDSYRKRLNTSMGTQNIKLPKSGVEVCRRPPAAVLRALHVAAEIDASA